jgi:hypothetical protein
LVHEIEVNPKAMIDSMTRSFLDTNYLPSAAPITRGSIRLVRLGDRVETKPAAVMTSADPIAVASEVGSSPLRGTSIHIATTSK